MALFGRRPPRTTVIGSLKSGRRRRNQRRAAVLILFALSILFLEMRYRNRQEEESGPLSTPLTWIPAPQRSSAVSGMQRQEALQNAVDQNAAAYLASLFPGVIRRELDIPVTKFVLPAFCRAQQAGFQGRGGLPSWGELFTAFWTRTLPTAAAAKEATAGLTHLLQISRREHTWEGGGDAFSVIVRGDTTDGKRITLAPRRRWDFEDGTYVFGFTVLDTARYQLDITLRHTRYGAFVAPDAGDRHALTGKFFAVGADAQCPPAVIDVKIEASRVARRLSTAGIAGPVLKSEGFAADDRAATPLCGNDGTPAGRWIDDRWEPWSCRYSRISTDELQTCAQQRDGLSLVFLGDTSMRSIYFEVADILKGIQHDREDEKLLTTIRKDNVLLAYHPWDITKPEQLKTHLATVAAEQSAGRAIVVFNTDLVQRLDPTAYISTLKGALEATDEHPTVHFVFANGVATNKAAPPPPSLASDDTTEEDLCSKGCGPDRYATAERVAQYARIGTHTVERDSPRAVQILDLFAISEPMPATQERSQPSAALAEAANVILNMACS
ncbi:hypothetical protein BDZ88DRAFT_258489 [Geranomyces variabilis]|nr:hypothetical protein BDZ88DRAFT_258489 [Geranomyces variabilis]KAJ3139163.1 hypothetical protein HDU90_000526 [Geranomyces variabilis]